MDISHSFPAQAWDALPADEKRRRLERELEALRARHRKLKRTKLKHATCDKKTAVRDEAADIGETIAGIMSELAKLPPPPPKHKKQLAPRAPVDDSAPDPEEAPAPVDDAGFLEGDPGDDAADARDPAPAPAPDDDDDAVGDLFAAAEAAAAVAPPIEHTPAAPARAVEPAVVWSGATPREKLDQWCRERGNPKPQYEVASKETLRCRVWAPQRERIQKKNARKAKGCAAVGPPTLVATADVGDAMLDPWARSRACPGGASGAGRDFAATKALYALSPELPLYRVLPPPFRGWWLDRLEDARAARDAENAISAEARQQLTDKKLDDVLQQVLAAMEARAVAGDDGGAAAPAPAAAAAPPQPKDAWEDPAPATDSWEDLLSSDDEAAAPAPSEATASVAAPESAAAPEAAAAADARRLKQTKAGDEWKAWWLARKRSKGYSAMRETRSALPAAKSRDAFVDAAAFAASPRHADGIVVCGETGSGKTTQLPHFILDSELCAGGLRASDVRIIVTQPRRVAATSVARRVAEECGEDDVGGLVGYHIRHERRVSSRTKLLFCTAGVLLRMLRGFSDDGDGGDGDDGDAFVRGATHIILDEVHERAADSDLLLAALRRAVAAQRREAAARRRKLTLVLMSATLDAKLFQKYLDTGTGKAATPTPVLSISGRAHPVAEYFLEDVVAAAGHRHDFGGAAGFAESGPGPSVRVARRDGGDDGRLERAMARYRDEEAEPHSGNARLDYELVVAAIESVVDGDFADGAGESDDPAGGDARRAAGAGTSTLVFLPGVAEIRRVADLLRGGRRFADGFVVAELHANAARDEQRKAFDPAPPGCRKVVLATNVAESSVTLPDVTAVVDCGRVKEVRHHTGGSEKLFAACPTLLTSWCSRASARQRCGRAGRVRPGVCVRLYSREHYDRRLADHQEPELMRVPLEELLLSVKLACDDARATSSTFFGSAAEWLGECPQPPPTHALSAALSELVSVGALAHAVEGEDDSWAAMEASLGAGSDASLALTPLGRHLARLPVHPRLGKMLVYGTLFGCVGPAASVAAAVGAAGRADALFAPDATRSQKAARARLAPPRADLVAAGRALDAYRGEPGQRGRAALARELGLHEPAVREALDARDNFVALLERAGLLGRGASGRRAAPANRHAANANVVAAVLLGALAPHVGRVDAAARADDGAAIRGAAVELSVPRVASARAAGDADAPAAGAAPKRKAVKFDKAKLSPSSFLALGDLDAAACHVAFFSRRWDTNRSKLLLGGCAVATPFALLLMYPGDLEVRHAKREATIANWMTLTKVPARTAVLLRELRKQLGSTIQALFEAPAANSDEAAAATIDVVARLLAEEPTRAILGE